MSGNSTEGRVFHERHDHILKIVIDNPAKIPKMPLSLPGLDETGPAGLPRLPGFPR